MRVIRTFVLATFSVLLISVPVVSNALEEQSGEVDVNDEAILQQVMSGDATQPESRPRWVCDYYDEDEHWFRGVAEDQIKAQDIAINRCLGFLPWPGRRGCRYGHCDRYW